MNLFSGSVSCSRFFDGREIRPDDDALDADGECWLLGAACIVHPVSTIPATDTATSKRVAAAALTDLLEAPASRAFRITWMRLPVS